MEHLEDSDEADDNLVDDISTLLLQEQMPGFPGLGSSDEDEDTPRWCRCPNKTRNVKIYYKRFQRICFCNSPIYGKRDFKRWFLMKFSLYHWIGTGMRGRGLFAHHHDANGGLRIHQQIRIIAALQILAHSIYFDQADELFALGATNIWESF